MCLTIVSVWFAVEPRGCFSVNTCDTNNLRLLQYAYFLIAFISVLATKRKALRLDPRGTHDEPRVIESERDFRPAWPSGANPTKLLREINEGARNYEGTRYDAVPYVA
jgi:hypothetical protein